MSVCLCARASTRAATENRNVYEYSCIWIMNIICEACTMYRWLMDNVKNKWKCVRDRPCAIQWIGLLKSSRFGRAHFYKYLAILCTYLLYALRMDVRHDNAQPPPAWRIAILLNSSQWIYLFEMTEINGKWKIMHCGTSAIPICQPSKHIVFDNWPSPRSITNKQSAIVRG